MKMMFSTWAFIYTMDLIFLLFILQQQLYYDNISGHKQIPPPPKSQFLSLPTPSLPPETGKKKSSSMSFCLDNLVSLLH